MHHHLEIIMPPSDDVQAAVTEILHPFNENPSDPENEDRSMEHAFWDWWVIGGRWSGHKLLHLLGEQRVNDFYGVLEERKITVSGVRAGKPTLSPASQAAVVDK